MSLHHGRIPVSADQAIANEAVRRFQNEGPLAKAWEELALITIALVRSNWTPVNPDLVLARKIAAETWDYHESSPGYAAVMRGDHDGAPAVRSAHTAIEHMKKAQP